MPNAFLSLLISSRSRQCQQNCFRTISTSNINSKGNERKENKKELFKLSKSQRKALRLVLKNDVQGDDTDNDDSLQETLERFKLEQMEQEKEMAENSVPTPWHSLLGYPSRATWRSSPKPIPSYISSVQFNLVQRSERTSKQLKRTHQNMIVSHAKLAMEREKERRRIVNSDKSRGKIASSPSTSVPPIYYKPEQTLCSLRYRLVPNYAIVSRVLSEVRGLLGANVFSPSKILDVGSGVGSSSAATLEYFFHDNIRRMNRETQQNSKRIIPNNIEWIHCIDASQSMRDAATHVLHSVIHAQENLKLKLKLRTAQKPRITFGESLTSSTSLPNSYNKEVGTFDLALVTYTMSELPSVPASLSMAAIVWEKLALNGVAIFIEPGTPDGFNALRAVRNMLLECCPPDDRYGPIETGDEEWSAVEECHVIAPCTHNGTCPMERHKSDFRKDKDLANASINLTDDFINIQNNSYELEDVINEEELEETGEFDNYEHYDNDDDDDIDYDNNFMNENVSNAYASNEEKEASQNTPSASTTNAFDSAFCSFVHALPGGGRRRKGEKFTYLVVQKRSKYEQQSRKSDQNQNEAYDLLESFNVAELLAESIKSARKARDELTGSHLDMHSEINDNLSVKNNENNNIYWNIRNAELLNQAVDMENNFLESDDDPLGLEYLRGDTNRSSWGRIVRAPIKRRGHVILDYCTSRKNLRVNDIDQHSKTDLTEDTGIIMRHRISRGESRRVAPGMYVAARKARWGGFWPDVAKI